MTTNSPNHFILSEDRAVEIRQAAYGEDEATARAEARRQRSEARRQSTHLPDEWETVPNRSAGLAFLNRDGNLCVPCSRYGSDTFDCSPVAWRVAYLLARETGEPLTYRDLDYAMGLVVNNDDDVAYIVRNYGGGHYR